MATRPTSPPASRSTHSAVVSSAGTVTAHHTIRTCLHARDAARAAHGPKVPISSRVAAASCSVGGLVQTAAGADRDVERDGEVGRRPHLLADQLLECLA